MSWHTEYKGDQFVGVTRDEYNIPERYQVPPDEYPNPVIPFYESDAARMERISLEQYAHTRGDRVPERDGRMYVTPEKPESGGVLGFLVVLAIVAAVIFLAGWV